MCSPVDVGGSGGSGGSGGGGGEHLVSVVQASAIRSKFVREKNRENHIRPLYDAIITVCASVCAKRGKQSIFISHTFVHAVYTAALLLYIHNIHSPTIKELLCCHYYLRGKRQLAKF